MASPVKKVLRKSPVLKCPAFGCLKGVPAVNVTRGCLHRCSYCYARSFPETPQGEVHLYDNLPQKLSREITSRRRLPQMVTFSTASDLFQPHPEILKITYLSLKVLLEAGIGVSFLTKGRISGEFWDLFAAYQGLVKARFGLVSLSLTYQGLFEPRTANPYLRLRQIERANLLGLEPRVRVDPVVPGITDQPEEIFKLLRTLKNVGVEEVSVSYLVLRPGVIRQLRRELPNEVFVSLLKAYEGMPWCRVITSATTKLAKKNLREEGYRIFRQIGEELGLKVRICGCKNPDLPFEPCFPWEGFFKGKLKQGELFGTNITGVQTDDPC